MIDLSIIIVNYNTSRLLKDCLTSIFSTSKSLSKEVIVVDNNSNDDSIEMIESSFPQVAVLKNKENIGFAKANNQGVERAKGKYILLLNSDTLVRPRALQQLLSLAQQHNADIASCQLLNHDGTIQPQGGALPNLFNITAWMLFIDDLPVLKKLFPAYQRSYMAYYKKNQKPGWLGGTALLVKKDVYLELGGMNPDIFMYGEDVEFCLKAKRQGNAIYYFSKPKIIHLGQGSGSSAKAILGEYKGLLYIFKSYYSNLEYQILTGLLKIGAFLRVLIFGMILKDENKKDIYTQAYKLA